VVVDGEVDLSVVGYRPASDLASIHSQDQSWCCFLLYRDSACFGVGSVDKILGCPTIHLGGGVRFFSIGSNDPYFDHNFILTVVPGCSYPVWMVWFRNGFLPQVVVAISYSQGPLFPTGSSSGLLVSVSLYVASAVLYGFFQGVRVFLGWGHSHAKCPFWPQL